MCVCVCVCVCVRARARAPVYIEYIQMRTLNIVLLAHMLLFLGLPTAEVGCTFQILNNMLCSVLCAQDPVFLQYTSADDLEDYPLQNSAVALEPVEINQNSDFENVFGLDAFRAYSSIKSANVSEQHSLTSCSDLERMLVFGLQPEIRKNR